MCAHCGSGRYDFALPDNPRWDQTAKKDLNIHYTDPLLVFQDLIDSGQVEAKTASKPDNLIRMAMAGRVTVFNLAEPVAKYHFRKLGVEGRFEPARNLMPQINSQYHLSSMKHPELIEAFDRFLQDQQTEVNALLEHYGLR